MTPDEHDLSQHARQMLGLARAAGLTIERTGSVRAWRFTGRGVDVRTVHPRWLQPRDLLPVRR